MKMGTRLQVEDEKKKWPAAGGENRKRGEEENPPKGLGTVGEKKWPAPLLPGPRKIASISFFFKTENEKK